jgi:type IV pilus assembly protein PilY1
VFANLYQLTDPDYSHRYFVDASPTTGDAYFDPDTSGGGSKSWHSVLVSGLNKGGQGIFALDITNPNLFSESKTDTVLWEFSDADDTSGGSDKDTSTKYALGDTFSQPAIARLHNGRWVAIFGNGYNNTRADDHASINGDAVLYILDIGTGEVIRKISTRTGSAEDPTGKDRANGLATPTLVDENSDHIMDYAYAGDLFGNLWKFDLRSENTSEWDIYNFSEGGKAPLFTARDSDGNHQPITTRPRVGRGPYGYGMMVYVGTGQYLSTDDISDKSVQSIYGLIDYGSTVIKNRSELQEQSIIAEFTPDDASVEVRVTTNNALGTMLGWYLDFDSPNYDGTEGERLVQTPVLRSGRLIFNTLIPTSDSCGYGGDSWLMELDAYSGSRLSLSPFDVNSTGKIDPDDFVTYTVDGKEYTVPSSGIKYDNSRSGTTIVSTGDGGTVNIGSDATGELSITRGNTDINNVNRQSWRQLR